MSDVPDGMTGGPNGGGQRWLEGQDSYAVPNSVIRTSDFEVAPIDDDNTARAFIEQHHYSGSYPSARFRYGLYKGPRLVGVAVYSHPVRDVVLTKVFGGEATNSTELGRFVLLDGIEDNGESWFFARTRELLAREDPTLRGIVSFSDPFVRTAVDGRVICPGHVGTIYQASNGVYLGRARAEGMILLPDGTSLPRRAITKLWPSEKTPEVGSKADQARRQGWHSVVRRLVGLGVTAPKAWLARPDREAVKRPLTADESAELEAWIDGVVADPTVCRKVKHPGNHKYAWALNRRWRRCLPKHDPSKYPKRDAA